MMRLFVIMLGRDQVAKVACYCSISDGYDRCNWLSVKKFKVV
ncbi:hypothetical protein LCBD_2617 [Lacticaseibacillus paracasei]|uniref:Uncharacterized protein n=2 Tax=Lacticaseibacillus paracasei subsp. paracasei TaxID=47714 RepID=A0AAP9HKC2_LACPA|nr:hypothetical protein LCAZH_2397 [Lacticaseibacillus paracasei]EEI68843.1 hypothetical protein HMPREF0530_0858 [Lacticaseibacillus paracasei subsp. paracasei ATCC 25302 = DSM 5622 = JCM 8130]EPC17621.1 hypothetical protein Lpp226_2282 [Lacticaseibacillus paracasei subsp. paracasei Lpp226]EPC24861.1 hypothetical protein Lpp22_2067 [Lacticaseibacillus paracasei subsp. paracasei Lpp22]EPC25781.1 hypothetical protein Lpp46_1877 [Lacticaseibacillus paracasei subsp. paracasei Lpp46]QGV19122.1 Hypo